MINADYTYMITMDNIISIVDHDAGRMTVTNLMDIIVKDIVLKNKIVNPPIVVYCDSDGVWDGYHVLFSAFISINATNEKEALDAVRTRLKEGYKK